jgi:hypothetical protein
VVEDETGETVKALLYRGTPDNPGFWRRALLDLPFAAGMMIVCCITSFYVLWTEHHSSWFYGFVFRPSRHGRRGWSQWP